MPRGGVGVLCIFVLACLVVEVHSLGLSFETGGDNKIDPNLFFSSNTINPISDTLWNYRICTANSTDEEAWAAILLQKWVQESCLCTVPIVLLSNRSAGIPCVAIGYEAALAVEPGAGGLFSDLGFEGFVLQATQSGDFIASGSNSTLRGNVYAVAELLQTEFGFRFFASDYVQPNPNVYFIPSNISVPSGNFSRVVNPVLEYRGIFAQEVQWPTDVTWSALVRENSNFTWKPGMGVAYAAPPGFVHTSFAIVPPSNYSTLYPEWFGETVQQLCWANQSLVDFVIQRVIGFLREQPTATIISVSQNDNTDYCKRPADMAIIEEEGSPSGPLLRAVNQVADAIKEEFPNVAVDTLAYEYTLPPPKITKPRPNVIIRLCDIDSNFLVPLDSPKNSDFFQSLQGWSKLTQRMYMWNYITDFKNWVVPMPDYFVIGRNIQILSQNGVRGIFEEGDYRAVGGDMMTMKNYVATQMMWNPSGNATQHMMEFLQGYYGPTAWEYALEYMNLWVSTATALDAFVGENDPITAPYFTPLTLLSSAAIWNKAMNVTTDPSTLLRVQQAALPTLYVVLMRWDEIKVVASLRGIVWPYNETKLEAFNWFSNVYKATGMNRFSGPQQCGLSENCHDLTWFWSQLFPFSPEPPGMTEEYQNVNLV